MPKISETPRDLRKKLTRSTVSRNSLKEKLKTTQYEIKKLKNCLSAMTTSREKWRLKCKESNILSKNLQQEVFDITQNRDQLIIILEKTNSLIPKKTAN